MLTLAVDTSSASGSLALLRDSKVSSQVVSSRDEPYSGTLLRQARELLQTEGVSLEQIELFAVNAGPGSFTGLRVGLTTVKGWAEVWRRSIAAISGLEAVAMQVSNSAGPGSVIAAALDARRGQIFGGVFKKNAGASGMLERVGEEVVAGPDEFLGSLPPEFGHGTPLLIACTEPEVIRPATERASFTGCKIEVVSNVLAPLIGRIGYGKALRGDVVDALHLDANYIRRSDAEMNWRTG